MKKSEETAEKLIEMIVKGAEQQLYLDLIAHFSDYTVPLTMTAKQVQAELEKFMWEREKNAKV